MINDLKTKMKPNGLDSLYSPFVINSVSSNDFNHLSRLAAEVCGTNYAVIILNDEINFCTKSIYGYKESEVVIENLILKLINDISDNVSVNSTMDLIVNNRSLELNDDLNNQWNFNYAAQISKGNQVIGNLCVFDCKSYTLTDKQQELLALLSTQVIKLVELEISKWELSEVLKLQELKKKELRDALKLVSDYKTAIDSSAIVAITDVKGNIKYVNDTFCKISGFTEEELLGQNQRIVSSGYHSREFWKKMWSTIGKGNVWQGEIRNRTKNGEHYWVGTTIVPFIDEQSNKPYQYVSIRRDITDEKKLEEQILNSIIYSQEKDREDFAYDLHEGLAQMLIALTLKIELIESGIQDTEVLQNIGGVKYLLNESVEKARTLAVDLMPRTMMDFGLVPSLDTYLTRLSAKTQVDIVFSTNINEETLPDKNIEITIYRSIVTMIEHSFNKGDLLKMTLDLLSEDGFACELVFYNFVNEPTKVESTDSDKNMSFHSVRKRIELSGGRFSLNDLPKENKRIIQIHFARR